MMLSWLCLVAAAFVIPGHAQTSSADGIKRFVTNYTDASPVLRYAPFGTSDPLLFDAQPETGWNESSIASDWSNYQPGEIANGTSYHVTSKPGATVSLDWSGQRLRFFGSFGAGGGSLSLSIDGGDEITVEGKESLFGNTLIDSGYINEGYHHAVVTVKSGLVYISRFSVVREYWNTIPKLFLTRYAQELPEGSGKFQIDESVSTDGGTWVIHSNLTGPPGSDPFPYPHISCDTVDCRASLRVDKGATSVDIVGTSGYDHGEYQVSLTPGPADGAPAVQSFNAFQPYTGVNGSMYFAKLDPKKEYTISLSIKGPGPVGSKIGIYGLRLAKTRPTAAIVGAAVGGGVVLFAILGGVGFLLWRRRRQRAAGGITSRIIDKPRSQAQFEIEETGSVDDSITPFHKPGVQSLAPAYLAPGLYPPGPGSTDGGSSVGVPPSAYSDSDGNAPLLPPGSTVAGSHLSHTTFGTPSGATSSQWGGSSSSAGDSSTPQQLGLALAGPAALAAGAGAPGGKASYIRPDTRSIVNQEQDVGPVIENIPPSYNPDWAAAASARASKASPE